MPQGECATIMLRTNPLAKEKMPSRVPSRGRRGAGGQERG
jgi:hypothetical protein